MADIHARLDQMDGGLLGLSQTLSNLGTLLGTVGNDATVRDPVMSVMRNLANSLVEEEKKARSNKRKRSDKYFTSTS